jgi:hypothetical protein
MATSTLACFAFVLCFLLQVKQRVVADAVCTLCVEHLAPRFSCFPRVRTKCASKKKMACCFHKSCFRWPKPVEDFLGNKKSPWRCTWDRLPGLGGSRTVSALDAVAATGHPLPLTRRRSDVPKTILTPGADSFNHDGRIGSRRVVTLLFVARLTGKATKQRLAHKAAYANRLPQPRSDSWSVRVMLIIE